MSKALLKKTYPQETVEKHVYNLWIIFNDLFYPHRTKILWIKNTTYPQICPHDKIQS